MTTMNLKRIIAIHQGWDDVAPEPDWTGTVEVYWEANGDTLTLNEIRDMLDDLDAGDNHQIGGGASPVFTIKEVT
jgi:hypothetical protein